MKYCLYLLLVLAQISCNNTRKSSDQKEEIQQEEVAIPVEKDGGIGNGAGSIENLFINRIENAHHKESFLKHEAIQFDVDLSFGGKQRLDATITMLTNSTKIKIIKKDGSELLYDGENVYLSPTDANDKGARFDIFTWTYFFGFPYKLSDPGTQWEMQGDKTLKNKTYSTAKLSFEKGTGDAPDDWYIAFVNPETNLIRAAAYIVTFGNDGEISKAESDPHIIVYENYQNVQDIPIATSWKFYGWTPEKGITQELGEATVSNIRFINDSVNSLFTIPESNKIIPAPQ